MAVPEGPFSAQSAPGATSAPAAYSAPGAPSVPGTPGQATGYETYEAHAAQGPGAHAAGSQAPASQYSQSASHPWGSRTEGEVGMSSVFPTATARAEAERAQQGGAPQAAAHPQAAAQQGAQDLGVSQRDAVASGPSVPQATPVAPAAHPAQPGSSAEAFPVRGEAAGSDESLGSWLLATFLSALPVVGIIYLLVVGFTSSGSPARRTWARAMLLWAVVGTILGIVATIVLGGSLLAVPNSQGA
ncbi:hypothetical protein MANAM107_09530 [Actinomyces capricornis]|uniref:Uncharacterized protein n=2 Tax=Actinomyces capricornis TaxID=2755559 RepID=A0ABM7U9L1_9ACTO|nr:hypothetical protein MANAM107_09530 [Actinomyces capricornis]